MSEAHWTVTLDFSSDDGEGCSDLKIQISNLWESEHDRSCDECVAQTMGYIVAMLRESGQIVPGLKTEEGVVEAFKESFY